MNTRTYTREEIESAVAIAFLTKEQGSAFYTMLDQPTPLPLPELSEGMKRVISDIEAARNNGESIEYALRHLIAYTIITAVEQCKRELEKRHDPT